MVKISLMQFLTFKACVSTDAKYNYVYKQKYREIYNPAHDYWRVFREAIKELPANGGDLSVLYIAIDKVNPGKKGHYTRAVKNFVNFVKNNNVTFFSVGKATWNMNDDLIVNASPDIGFIIDGQKYFVKIFPNVSSKSKKLNKKAANSILTLMQETSADFDTESGTYAILKIMGTKLFRAEPIKEKDIQLLKIDAQNFVDFWNAM